MQSLTAVMYSQLLIVTCFPGQVLIPAHVALLEPQSRKDTQSHHQCEEEWGRTGPNHLDSHNENNGFFFSLSLSADEMNSGLYCIGTVALFD